MKCNYILRNILLKCYFLHEAFAISHLGRTSYSFKGNKSQRLTVTSLYFSLLGVQVGEVGCFASGWGGWDQPSPGRDECKHILPLKVRFRPAHGPLHSHSMSKMRHTAKLVAVGQGDPSTETAGDGRPNTC